MSVHIYIKAAGKVVLIYGYAGSGRCKEITIVMIVVIVVVVSATS